MFAWQKNHSRRNALAPAPATPPENVRRLKRLTTRDIQLWSIGFMVMLVLLSGVLLFIIPNTAANLKIETRYIPQLALGLIVLVLLLNFYLIEQRRELDRMKQQLVQQITYEETVEKLAIMDPVTNVFNRRYLDELLTRELQVANRADLPLTLVVVQHAALDVLVARHGRTLPEQFA